MRVLEVVYRLLEESLEAERQFRVWGERTEEAAAVVVVEESVLLGRVAHWWLLVPCNAEIPGPPRGDPTITGVRSSPPESPVL